MTLNQVPGSNYKGRRQTDDFGDWVKPNDTPGTLMVFETGQRKPESDGRETRDRDQRLVGRGAWRETWDRDLLVLVLNGTRREGSSAWVTGQSTQLFRNETACERGEAHMENECPRQESNLRASDPKGRTRNRDKPSTETPP